MTTQVENTTKRSTCPPVNINNQPIPQASEARYLGLHLDRRLTWKAHVTKKRKEMDIKIRNMNWLIGKKSLLNLDNKLLLYKAIIRPVWLYGCELWGCASNSTVDIIQRFQSKTLRIITGAPWFVSNRTLHADLNIPYVKEAVKQKATKYHDVLQTHPNEVIEPLKEEPNYRRLKKKWPQDLLQ